jgi:hypothetical protein
MTGVLADSVRIRGRFHRSVNLGADWGDPRSLAEFIPTPTIVSLAEQICAEATHPGGVRAWSLTGPYGAGKSAFALFVADILANRRSRHPESQRLRDSLHMGKGEFHPVLLTAERGAIAEPLRSALATARRQLSGVSQGRPRTDLTSVLLTTAQEAKKKRKAGLLLIVDELGKFLEFAAARPSESDVFLLQQLAEVAARSPVPIVLVTVLHSGFADYLPPSEEVRRNEWQKVQGRFQDVPYQLPADQALELVAGAIDAKVSPRLKSAWAEIFESCLQRVDFSETTYKSALSRSMGDCAPLHPLALALLWPLFRSKGAQNERSLFSFLTSSEPFGFESFLQNTELDPGTPLLYRIPRLYDYITHALGVSAFRGDKARRWSQVDQALTRLPPDAPPGTGDVLKAIGLVEILGNHAGLRADPSTIAEAVEPTIDAPAVLQFLEERSMILFRRHLGAFGLWDGSDFDLESAFAEAQVRVRRDGSLARQLGRLFPPRPWVAQRHYLECGTMRHFEVQYVDDIDENLAAIAHTSTEADGRIVFVFPLDQLALAARPEFRAADANGKPLIVATPSHLCIVNEDLVELEAWDYVAHHSHELSADQAARQEVRARLQDARNRLAQRVGPQLGLPGHLFEPALTKWSYGQELFNGSTVEEFKHWLSTILDRVYEKGPHLRNELLNRGVLSSAASKARRNLLEAMLKGGAQSRLGLQGYPPERSMYESMLANGGFHRKRGKSWRWSEPAENWAAAYRYVGQYIRGSTSQRRPVLELYRALKSPPFGMREGPLPVLLLAYLLERADEAALYEEGVLVPDLRMEVVERLLRRPDLFEVRSHKLTPSQLKALALFNDLGTKATSKKRGSTPEKALIPVVRSLVGFVASLPSYVKQTRRLEPSDTVAVRDLLLSATDPARLLFTDLPGALGIRSFEGNGGVVFAERLRDRMRLLGRAYPCLVDDLEQQIRGVFGLSGTSEAAYHQLQQRALVILPLVADQRLKTFVLEAARDLAGRDWREGLARALKDGFPVTHWKDADLSVFQVRLREVASDFLRLEELAAEQGRSGARRVVRIGLLDADGQEIRRVIPIEDREDPEVLRLMTELSSVLQGRTDGSGDYTITQLEALGRVAAELIREQAPLSEVK